MNLALKSILDRYSACTLDLPLAEQELRDCLSCVKPVAIISSPKPMTIRHKEEVSKHWAEAFDGTCSAVVLDGGLKLENQHRYQPSAISAKVGNFALEWAGPERFGWEASFDGIPIREHRKIEIVLEAGSLPCIKVEFVTLPPPKDIPQC